MFAIKSDKDINNLIEKFSQGGSKQKQVPAESESTPNFPDNIFEEPDKALLLSLLLLFKGDKANEELMTALIYIML